MSTGRTRCWLLPAALLAGCAAPPFAALAFDGVGRVDCATVVDTELFDVLRVGEPRLTRDGVARFGLPVQSLDDEPLDVLATVRFVDAAGQAVPGAAVRQRLRLLPGEVTTCVAEAADPVAAAAVVEFDWDR